MDFLTLFGLFAVTAMLVCYACETRSHWFILAFALSCWLGSAYGFLQGAWPFGLVEMIWGMVALRRWFSARKIAAPQSVISSSQMKELDRKATEVYGIPSLLLMENAGRGTAEIILRNFPDVGKIGIFCGKGNNGGDGFVIARHLFNCGKEIRVALLADPSELKGDCRTNYEIAVKLGIPVSCLSSSKGSIGDLGIGFPLKACGNDGWNADLIVDAIFGIGIQSEVTGIYRKAIEAMNQSGKPVVAVDIPSG